MYFLTGGTRQNIFCCPEGQVCVQNVADWGEIFGGQKIRLQPLIFFGGVIAPPPRGVM